MLDNNSPLGSDPVQQQQAVRPASFWENAPPGGGISAAEGGDEEETPAVLQRLLLRGGVTLRAGAWVGGVDADKVWGGASPTAAAAAATAMGVRGRSTRLLGSSVAGDGDGAWAVEVGWLVEEEEGVGVEKRGRRRRRREVLTTVFESGTMVPLAVWKGVEEEEEGEEEVIPQ